MNDPLTKSNECNNCKYDYQPNYRLCMLKYKNVEHPCFVERERQNTKIATLEELVNELSNKKDKLLEILTLAVCNFGTSYYGKIYNMAVKTIQKENRDKTWEDIKAEVKQKNDING